MTNHTLDNRSNDLENLMNNLAPEIDALELLTLNMAKIKSPYQNEFKYIHLLKKMLTKDSTPKSREKIAMTVIQELDEFGTVLTKLAQDDEVRELYTDAGLFDSCLSLQQNIARKLGFDN